MIKDIQELNFPSYANLSSATVTLNDMGDRTISAQVKIDGDIVPDFSYDWEVEFKGERYIQPLRQPQAGKSNDSISSKIDLVFQHKTIYELKRYYFVEMTSTMSGTAIADQYIASLGLNLDDFCVAFQRVLDHYFNGAITIDLNPNIEYTKGVQFMSISYSYIWDVLQKVYEVYGVRWHIEGNTIKVGYPSPILSHTFQYGYEGGLLQVERQVQDANIRNSLLGRGGEQNLPAYYFKEAPEGSLFASDPDAIPELANIYFSNLRGKTFRDYVKGWKAKHYGGAPMSKPTDAYTKGYTDTKFNPIEYVEDKESIKKYGLLQGALDNNEEIYPSIQGAPNGEDVVVYVEPITSDDVEQSVGKAETIALNGMSQYKQITREQNGGQVTITLQSEVFEVPNDSYALAIGNNVTYNIYRGFNLKPIWEGNVLVDVTEVVTNKTTNQIVDKSSLSKGKYQVVTTFNMTLPIYEDFPPIGSADNITFSAQLGVSTNLQLRKLQDGATDKWLPTFDIWVKNIWHSTRNVGESDEQYAERVWRPILGDRQGDEAKVVFSSGWLSGHEDYEFTIVDFAYDNSHEGSEWRLTLNKSDAELEATGKYIPSASTNGQAYAGDTFFFIGIDMPHQYVLWAEERLDNYKTSSLNEVSEIQPKWVVRFDKLRLHEDRDNLAEQIVVGGAINLADVRFIDAPALQLYLQSVTYTWNEQTLLYPDIEVVLADTIKYVQNPVAQLQGSIDTINSQLANIGNVAQVVRKIGDSLYLRKDGVADTSKSPTKFVGEVSGNNFRRGKVGGADWAIYRDENGNAIAEFDKIIARKDLEANNLVINQVSYVGGMQITSAASLEITRVIENDNAYQCFFDQKRGSVANLFRVNDIAYSQRFDEENNTTKYYKRVVIAVDVDSITLSKSQADGEGEPMANDVVIHYGNITDTNRQYVIIRDVIGGGYERMLSDLNSVSASGVEYYFAGRLDGNTPRWFVGNNEQFIEYKDGHLRIKADVTLGEESTLPDNLNVDYLKKAFPQGSILDVNGVTLSALIGVKDNEDKVVAGIYGGASNTLNEQGYADEEHGAMLLFGGIDGADKPKSYKTAIFEDGYIESEYFATARKNERVEIFDNQIKIYGSDGKTHILLGWSTETGNPHLQYVDANGARPWLITEQGVSNAVTIDTAQSINGLKDFANGLKIGGVSVVYNAEKNALILPCNLLVERGMAFNSSIDGFTPQTITDAVKIDGVTIRQNASGELYAIGGGGTGGEGGVSADFVASYVAAALVDYAPLANTLAGYGIADAYTRDEVDSAITAAFNAFATDISNDGIVNTYKELIDYAAAHGSEFTALVGQVANKADKATTLAGYGITDAYTKMEVDSAFAKKATTLAGYGIADAYTKTEVAESFVDKTSAQSISGIKDFANGLKIGGVSVVYNAEKNALILPCNLLVEKGMAFNSSIDGFTPQTITDAVKIDGVTIRQNADGALYAVGGGGTGGEGGVSADFVASYVASALIPYATTNSVNSLLTDYLPRSGGGLSGNLSVDISSGTWALHAGGLYSNFWAGHNDGYGAIYATDRTSADYYILRCFYGDKLGRLDGTGVAALDVRANGCVSINTLESLPYTLSVFGDIYSMQRIRVSRAYNNLESLSPTLGSMGRAPFCLNVHNGYTTNQYGLYAWMSGSGNGHFQVGREDGLTNAYNLVLQELGGTVVIGGDIAAGNTSSYKLYVMGGGYMTGSLVQASARSLKNVAKRNFLALDELSQIIPYRYTWLDGRDSIEHIGGIADEVKDIMPEVVLGDSPDTLAMDYGVAAFVMASSLTPYVSDHDRRIEALERENVALKEEIKKLKAA